MTSISIPYAAGRHAWLDGGPRPSMPPRDAPDHEHQFFLGYMREVARDYVMRGATTREGATTGDFLK